MQRSLAFALLSSAVYAQQDVWGQCGGQNWSGPTNCESGSTCSTLNPYYAQCVPGATTMVTTTTAAEDSPTKTSATATPTITSAPSGNPFDGYDTYANDYYRSEIYNLAIPSLSPSLVAEAKEVAEVPSFVWLDKIAKVPSMKTHLSAIREKNNAGADPPIAGIFVIYDLPDRDCAAAASNGELDIQDGGVDKYKHDYIDPIRETLVEFSDVQTMLVIEPDSLANMVTNMDVEKCANAADEYKACTAYAITNFDLPHVSMYLDAGHAGWLGWPANLEPTAQLFGELYKNAGSPAAVRGLATNVANYNAWTISPCPSYTEPNPNCDEKSYVNALAPLLRNNGFPAHFITDTSRNGVQPTEQIEWGHWCNVEGTGFGVRYTTDTGDPLEDAFIWVKPGGESDGTSDPSAPRYDHHCGFEDALQPAPEAGQWFQAYFEQLLRNANPPF